MRRTSNRLAATAVLTLAVCVCLWPRGTTQATADEKPAAPKIDPALTGSTIAVLLEANDGKPPATGKELWQVLSKIGKFAQLPVVFSAVRLDSGIDNPRVVIAPVGSGMSDAGAAEPNLHGRLYLAANMEKGQKGGLPFVASVEFISWNAIRRKFDFGVIENMGPEGEPRVTLVDGGRCFTCHKNRGPILGVAPWTNSTNHGDLRALVADKYVMVAVGAAGGGRDRIDGMALVTPEAAAVDEAVRAGSVLRINRERFRLMNRSAAGRKAFVALLAALTHAGPLSRTDRAVNTQVNYWANDASYPAFAADWLKTAQATNYGILIDFAPIPGELTRWEVTLNPLPSPPPTGFRTPTDLKNFEAQVEFVKRGNQSVLNKRFDRLKQLAAYDAARATGQHGMTSIGQPSNPKAFIQPKPTATQKPSGMVDPVLLAATIGLTEGDRKFMAEALAAAAKRLAKQRVTAAALAKAIFEGPEFADVLAGGAIPDRDDFKDRFVAGLNAVLKGKYKLTDGFNPERSSYAVAPKRDPKAIEEVEVAVVPTSACLRCHDVRAGAQARLFEPIPALPFDPLDKQARADWVRTADAKRKQAVLSRLMTRVFTDSDMPPHDAPEHDLFKLKQPAAFDGLKQFLEDHLEMPKKP